MWIFVTLIAIVLLGYFAMHHFRWPLFNAAIAAQRKKAGLVEKTVTIDGHEICYLIGGRGEPLVLIHGFGANKDHWAQIAPLLTPHYQLVLPDLPGFGESTRDPKSSYGAEAQLARLRSFIQSLDLGAVHIGGNSMGGFFAGFYGARFSDDTKSIWLLAPAGVEGAEPSEFFQRLETNDNVLLVDDAADFERLMDFCFTKAPYAPKAFLRCLAERNIEDRDFNARIFQEIVENPVALENEMAGCGVNTQIVWGDNDRILHYSGAAALAKVLRNATTVVMPAMGHCPMVERPKETAKNYFEFQRQVNAQT